MCIFLQVYGREGESVVDAAEWQARCGVRWYQGDARSRLLIKVRGKWVGY